MSFEKNFPSLKKAPYTILSGVKSHAMIMKPIQAEINYYAGMDVSVCVPTSIIELFCLDKQKVREAIENIRLWDSCGEPGCCDREFTASEVLEQVKKELGL